ncbi:zinc-binding dehydrogenase [Microlunatus sp. Gsoil 973]|nr:zinc-binding dehydrogenase [Microlunatus sp. Gsoil 973]
MMALRAHARGGPEQLRYEEAPAPAAPGDSEVCLQVRAAAITFDELTWPETWEADGVDRTPIIPSHEVSGVVTALGAEVQGLSVSEEVFGLVPFNRNGAAAEYVLVPAANLVRKPDGVSHVVAAAAVLPALTASEALVHSRLTNDQRLLVRGATGAVGSFVTQFAARMGIKVTATVRSASAVDRAKRYGADEVLVGDDVTRLDPASCDAAIDAAGAGTPDWAYRGVRPGGRLITLQEPPDADLAAAAGVDAMFFIVDPHPEELQRLADQLASGDIEVPIAQTYPLAEGGEAYAARGRTQSPGKIILTVP